MGLAAFNLLFIPAALFAHLDGGALVRAVATWSPLRGGATTAFVTLVMANIGATVTPWPVDDLLPAKRGRGQGPDHR